MLWSMSINDWITSFAFFCCMAYICGWITDRIMDKTGFGHIGNWLLLLGGAYSGMYAYNLYGYKLNWYPMWTLGVIVGSAALMLITMALVKRFVYN